MDTGKCRSCGEDIVWCETAAGKKQPLNAKSEKRVLVQFDPVRGVNLGLVMDTFVPHHATCPFAGQHRGAARSRP